MKSVGAKQFAQLVAGFIVTEAYSANTSVGRLCVQSGGIVGGSRGNNSSWLIWQNTKGSKFLQSKRVEQNKKGTFCVSPNEVFENPAALAAIARASERAMIREEHRTTTTRTTRKGITKIRYCKQADKREKGERFFKEGLTVIKTLARVR